MKIVPVLTTDKECTRLGTIVGELYQIKDSEAVMFRCQGGFVNMCSGEFTEYVDCTESVLFVHLPDARLHLGK